MQVRKLYLSVFCIIVLFTATSCTITGNILLENKKYITKDIAEEWIREKSPTYLFDGSGLMHKLSRKVKNCEGCYAHYFSFISEHIGYGNRSDELNSLDRMLVSHEIVVITKGDDVIRAVIDEEWDDLNSKEFDANNLQKLKDSKNRQDEESSLPKRKFLCKTEIINCPDYEKPVCGNDGKTYKNQCLACRNDSVGWYMDGGCP